MVVAKRLKIVLDIIGEMCDTVNMVVRLQVMKSIGCSGGSGSVSHQWFNNQLSNIIISGTCDQNFPLGPVLGGVGSGVR